LLIVKFHVIQNIHSTSETIAGKINQAIFLLKKKSRRDVFSGKRQQKKQNQTPIQKIQGTRWKGDKTNIICCWEEENLVKTGKG